MSSLAESALWELSEDFDLFDSLEESDFNGRNQLQNLN